MAKNFQKSEIKKAIEGSAGIISIIARRLKCDWHTAKKYIEKYKLQELVKLEDEKTNDLAEEKLIENIMNNESACIIYRLKTKGKNRGYTEKFEFEGDVRHSKMTREEFLEKLKELRNDKSI